MSKWLRCVEMLAWSAGLLCTGYLVMNQVQVAEARQAAASLAADRPNTGADLRPAEWVTSPAMAPAGSRTARSGQILGRLEIPDLKLTTPVVEGDDTRALLLGAGHIPGTAMPGGLGNFVVAAHRDTFFRALSGIKPGMKIRVVTADDSFVYVVDGTRIVQPEEVDVLDMGDVPQLTLVTCYPFHYIGAAPQRFTVQAHLVSF